MEQEKKENYEIEDLKKELDEIKKDMELLKRCCKLKEGIKNK